MRALPWILSLLTAVPVAADPRAEVMILGTYHMGNPGQDVFNMQADDVLSPKRQAEIGDLITVLKRFNPTKIAVEANIASQRIPNRYADYLAGRYELSRNEIDQIGLRLAKELGHKTIYPVDVEGEFPYARLAKYMKATGREAEWNALSAEIGAMVKSMETYLASHTILETLLNLNSAERVAEDVGFYFRQAEFGEPWDWAGADLVADWFRRNMRIYTNITRLAEPGERVLVIYGSGHLGWLQFPVASNPRLRVRKLAEFAKTPAREATPRNGGQH